MRLTFLFIAAFLTARTALGLVLVDTLGTNEEFVQDRSVWWTSHISWGSEEYFTVYQPIRNPLNVPIVLTEWIEWRGVQNYQGSYPMIEHRIAIGSSFDAVRDSPKHGDLYDGVTSFTAWQSPDKVDVADNPINRVTHDLRQNGIVIAPLTTVWASIFARPTSGAQVSGKLESSMFVDNPPHVQFFRGGYMFLVDSFDRQYSGATLDRITAEPVPEVDPRLIFAVGLGAFFARKRSSC